MAVPGVFSPEWYNDQINEGSSTGTLAGDITDSMGLTNKGEVTGLYNEAENALSGAYDTTTANTAASKALLGENYENIASLLGGDDSISNYTNLVNSYNPDDYTYAASDYTGSGKTVDDFVSAALGTEIANAQNSRSNTIAGQGNLLSGGASKQLDAIASTLTSDELDKAYNRYNTAESQAFNEYSTTEAAKQAEATSAANAFNTQSDLTSDLASSSLSNSNDYISNLLGLYNTDSSNATAYANALANLKSGEASASSSQNLAGMAGSVVGAIFG